VKTLVCAFGVHKAGVDFGGLDGRSAHVIILTLSPLFAPVPHIQFMAMMSRMLDEGCRERLLKAGTREEIWAILTGTQATAQARAAPQG
jgi:mannitol/fructose-specific phosphotransferase system IIA component (Ntr-type)